MFVINIFEILKGYTMRINKINMPKYANDIAFKSLRTDKNYVGQWSATFWDCTGNHTQMSAYGSYIVTSDASDEAKQYALWLGTGLGSNMGSSLGSEDLRKAELSGRYGISCKSKGLC